MATRYAVANGNWSDLATWDGGASLPTTGDDVYAGGKTVAIDQVIVCKKISTFANGSIPSGGGFTGGSTMTCNIEAGTTTCLSGTVSRVIVGNVTTSTVYGAYGINRGTNYITGNVYGGNTGASGINEGTNYITGNVYGGTGGWGIIGGTNYITGNVYGGTGAYGINGGTNYITGNVYGGDNSNVCGIADGVNTIIGHIYGGTSVNCYGIVGTGTNTITGNIYASNYAHGLENATATVTGNIVATSAKPAIGAKGIVYLTGDAISVGGFQACAGKLFMANTGKITMQNLSAESYDMYASGYNADFPAVDTVAKGVQYNNGQLVGTAILTKADIAEVINENVGNLFQAFNQ